MSLVSILMSVFNGEEFLRHAMASIQAQTLTDWELIVVNDGSTDGSAAALNDYAIADPRVRVIHQENRGLGPALHRAAGEAGSAFLARMDVDDISAPTRLARLLDYFSRRPDHVLAGTWAWRFVVPYGIYGAMTAPDDDAELRSRLDSEVNPLTHGSVMFRREAYVRVPGYRFPNYSEEYDLWLQLAGQGRLGVLPSIEYMYRENVSGMTKSNTFRAPQLGRLALRLAKERREGGVERTDWLSECLRIRNSCPATPEPLQRQMRNYALALIHLVAGYKGRAALSLARGLGWNAEGLRALSRLSISVVLGLRRPDPGTVVHSADGPRELLTPGNLEWTRPWLETMGLPAGPYCREWRASRKAASKAPGSC